MLNFDYFAADREFVSCVGRPTRLRDFEPEVLDYLDDPSNAGFLR